MISNRDAFVTAIVLWIVAALLMGIAYIMSLSKDTIFLTKSLNSKMMASIEAESFLEVLKFYIPTANFDKKSLIAPASNTLPVKLPSPIILDGREYEVGNVTFSLRDLSSMFNVRNPFVKYIANLATDESQRELRFILNDSLSDWVDKDDVALLNGAELQYYRIKKNVLYGPRNSPAIQSVKELHIIKGYDGLGYKKWKELENYLYYGIGTFYNLLLMDSRQLSAILNISLSEAESYISMRQKDEVRFIRAVSKLNSFDDSLMGFNISHNIFIKIEVKVGEAVSRIETIIDFSRYKTSPFITQFFNRY